MTWKTLPYKYNAFKVKQYANYALHSIDIMHVDEDSIRMIDFDAETTTVVRKRDLQDTFIFDIYIYIYTSYHTSGCLTNPVLSSLTLLRCLIEFELEMYSILFNV